MSGRCGWSTSATIWCRSASSTRANELPNVGLVCATLESGEYALIDTGSATVRRAYREREAAALARQRLFRSLGLDAIEVDTRESYMHPLMRFFRAAREAPQGRALELP